MDLSEQIGALERIIENTRKISDKIQDERNYLRNLNEFYENIPIFGRIYRMCGAIRNCVEL